MIFSSLQHVDQVELITFLMFLVALLGLGSIWRNLYNNDWVKLISDGQTENEQMRDKTEIFVQIVILM